MASNGIKLKDYLFVATLTVPLSHMPGSKMVHSGDVGVKFDSKASIKEKPHGRKWIFWAFLKGLN